MVRFKNRYIAIEVIPDRDTKLRLELSSTGLSRQILNTVTRLHGDFGVASIRNGFAASYCNDITRIAILRARHGPHKFVTSSLPILRNIGKVPVKVNTLYVGATLHQCYKVILKHQKESLIKILPYLKPEDKEDFESNILSIGGILGKKERTRKNN